MSINPGATILPRASIVSLASPMILGSMATMRPPAIATSRMPSSPTEGSTTRPPLMTKSYVAARTFGMRANIAAPAAVQRILAPVHHGISSTYQKFEIILCPCGCRLWAHALRGATWILRPLKPAVNNGGLGARAACRHQKIRISIVPTSAKSCRKPASLQIGEGRYFSRNPFESSPVRKVEWVLRISWSKVHGLTCFASTFRRARIRKTPQ